ncbi:MAG: UbiX family flavin prenyltransferase [Saprospiraceae bacterium]|nr:UbiX family flavin prenyltransferase [Saprospiraceae bacterium]
MKKIVVGIGGASGSIYAKVLLDRLAQHQDQLDAVGVVMSKNAKFNWEYELGNTNYNKYPFDFYDKNDYMAPFASGSARYNHMIICPCSMGQLGRFAAGISDNLISRAVDVILKERRQLVLVPRDTPLSMIHLKNMQILTEVGAIICPASPSFYSHPKTFEELAATVIDRVLDLVGIELKTYRWSETSEHPIKLS